MEKRPFFCALKQSFMFDKNSTIFDKRISEYFKILIKKKTLFQGAKKWPFSHFYGFPYKKYIMGKRSFFCALKQSFMFDKNSTFSGILIKNKNLFQGAKKLSFFFFNTIPLLHLPQLCTALLPIQVLCLKCA